MAEVVDPICKNLCKDCEHVLNWAMEKKTVWGFLGFWEKETSNLIIKPSCYWLCRMYKSIDCRDGQVKYKGCDMNWHGDCEMFSPFDPDDYDPRDHLIPE